jgi:hypothetical protein
MARSTIRLDKEMTQLKLFNLSSVRSFFLHLKAAKTNVLVEFGGVGK